MRTEEQQAERHLRNLLRRRQWVIKTAERGNHGAQGELAALSWALKLLATDARIPLTEVQRTDGVLRDIATQIDA